MDLLNKKVELMGNALQNMDQALRWGLEEIHKLKEGKDVKDIEVVDPNQVEIDFEAKPE